MHTTRPKSIQIEFSFFLDLFFFILEHGDPDDPKYCRIRAAFQHKIDAMERHNLYSLYKSGASEVIRRKARKEYRKFTKSSSMSIKMISLSAILEDMLYPTLLIEC